MVIAKTSSIDAPASIKVGIPLFVPILFPNKFNIEELQLQEKPLQ